MKKSLAVVSILLCCLVSAQTVHVTSGATDDQVFQRNADSRADIKLTGTLEGAREGKIEARVMHGYLAVPGFDWTTIATAQRGTWTGEIKGLPAGGPYRVELRSGANITATIHDILVGDLWMLAGQSNMEGVGNLVDTEAPHELVHSFDQADHWIVAEEPLHRLVDATDRVHWRRNAQKEPEKLAGDALQKYIEARKKGGGLGLPFAVEMVRRTGVPVGLLPCAHGGTSMDQWDPALKDKEGDSLYGATLRRFRLAGGRIKGVLWYQGESDTGPAAAPLFQAKFEKMVASMRDDFGQPNLPFYYVQIGRFVSATNPDEWNFVQEAQRKSEATIPNSGMVAAIDFSLDDGIHVSTADHKRLGKRLVNLALGDTKHGPRPVSASFKDGRIAVTFADVNGRLTAPGRVSGFSIYNDKNEYVPLIYKAVVDPADGNTILLYVGTKPPAGATLHYGRGKDPYCNVTDQADMAVPVFGPMVIQ